MVSISFKLRGYGMVFNATFNNISVISWRSVALVEYPEKPQSCCKSLTNFLTQCCIKYTSLAWAGFELTTLVVIGTDCTCSCKSNYHMTTTAPGLFIFLFKTMCVYMRCRVSFNTRLTFHTILYSHCCLMPC